MEPVRLQKYLAGAGVASRRKAEELICQGRVSINGNRITELGTKVCEGDTVMVDEKPVRLKSVKKYVMLNKPVGIVTTVKDQFGRKTVMDLVQEAGIRLFPVGRLDYDTSGLLLLTNDGDLTYRLTHPRHNIDKTYLAEVAGIPREEELVRFRRGLSIENYITAPAQVQLLSTTSKGNAILKITIHEGRNRQVRKMCSAIGHPVHTLQRVSMGPLQIGNLEPGQWRDLTEKELKQLQQLGE